MTSIYTDEPDQHYKDPQAKLDYSFRWHEWLSPGETIASATVTVPAGLTKAAPETVTGTEVIVWLSGGTLATTYLVTCHIVTTEGREDDRSKRIVIRNR